MRWSLAYLFGNTLINFRMAVPQCNGPQRLCLAAGEDGRPVDPRKNPDFAGESADVPRLAPVGTDALLEHHLTAQGLMVEISDDGEQAVELLLREQPDMVVLDIEIPKIDGLRVAEILRRYRHLTDVPVYLLSRIRDDGYLAYAKQLDIARLVKRPFAVRPFAREVRMMMGA